MSLDDLYGDSAAILALWTQVCAEPLRRNDAWSEAPTFVPFDALTMIEGVPAIVEHLARRDQIFGFPKLESCAVSCWKEEQSLIVIAETLMRHKPSNGEEETRRMRLVLAASIDEELRLRHVTEAVPAVLPLVIETYRRHPEKRVRL